MRIILIIFSLLYSTLVSAVAPYGIKGQAQTTIYPNVYQVPNSQVTRMTGINALIETGNENLLVNPDFEHATFTTGWTVAFGNPTVETTAIFQGKQAATVTGTGSGAGIRQLSTTNAANLKGQQGVARARVKTTSTTAQLCAYVDGLNEAGCIAVPVTTTAQPFASLEVPFIMGGTSNGLIVKDTVNTTAVITVDTAFVGPAKLLQNIAGDTEFTAQSNISAVVSNLNKAGWIATGSIAGAIYTFPISGFTVAPNCWAVNSTQGAGSARLLNTVSTSSTVAVEVTNSAGATATTTIMVGCQKTGVDYLSSSSSVYAQANANTDWAPYTPTYTGWGTVSTSNMFWRRNNGMLEIDGTFVMGTPTNTEQRISFPNSFATPSTLPTLSLAGQIGFGANLGSIVYSEYVFKEPSVSYMTIGFQANGTAGFSKNATTSFLPAGGTTIGVRAFFPIAGWSNTQYIVGTFQGTPNTPGYAGGVDTIVFSYGVGTTPCTSTPCTVDQVGTGVTSMTRTSAGVYPVTFARTYIKIKCQGNAHSLGVSNMYVQDVKGSNTNTVTISTNNVAQTAADSTGSFVCWGTY